MKKVLLSRPTSVEDVETYYDDMDDGAWQPKADRARARQWRQLKRQSD